MARFSAPADLRRQPTNVPLSAHLAAARAGEANKSAFSRDPALLSDSVIMASGSAARQVACQLQALRARARFGAGRQALLIENWGWLLEGQGMRQRGMLLER